MRAAILQPSYIPWRGAFHIVQKCDVFVFYDDVQYDKHGWRNRNRVKTAQGTRWLTIPVLHKGNVAQHTPVNQIRVNPDDDWERRHWQTLRQSYARAPFFERTAALVEPFYSRKVDLLADFTIDLTVALAGQLGLGDRRFLRASSLGVAGEKTDRLLAILAKVGATHYVSGPSARAYLDEAAFAAAGIGLEYMSYDYPAYQQLHGAFDPQVSILDLLFMQGPQAPAFIWGAGDSVAAR